LRRSDIAFKTGKELKRKKRLSGLSVQGDSRVLAPSLSVLDPRLPADVAARSSLSTAWHGFERNLDQFFRRIWSPRELDRFVNSVATKCI
jgi:hypothetical protein